MKKKRNNEDDAMKFRIYSDTIAQDLRLPLLVGSFYTIMKPLRRSISSSHKKIQSQNQIQKANQTETKLQETHTHARAHTNTRTYAHEEL